jgi:alpha-L-fucosidase
MHYEPTWESLREHQVPEWFDDAKLGVLLHWGLFSVPAFAPLTGELHELVAERGWDQWFAQNSYAEWYLNSIKIPGSPSHQYHLETYGEASSYDDFTPSFHEWVQQWTPDAWAMLLRRVGVRYVVFVAKHHDGFLLWPSGYPNPRKERYSVERDVVGELKTALQARGLKLGLYYSGGLDWTFDGRAVCDLADLICTIPRAGEYAEYVDRHWRELISRYEPVTRWNVIGYTAADLRELFAYYYNVVPHGVVNDRFIQYPFVNPRSERFLRSAVGLSFLALVVGGGAFSRLFSRLLARLGGHSDFRTLEYTSCRRATKQKWEATRGLGYSFGYNRNEGPDTLLSVRELVHLLADVVSKNGNLLLGVGPAAGGTIPRLQRERLLGLGRWLDVCGEAIFATRPWVKAEGRATDGIAVRFTKKGNSLYAILLDRPQGSQVAIKSLYAGPRTTVQLLGHDTPLEWTQDGECLAVTLPRTVSEAPAYALRITPRPMTG